MKAKHTQPQRRTESPAAALHAGQAGGSNSPRLSAQSSHIAQLQAATAPIQRVEGERKTKGFNRGKSHSSTTPSGKTTSHKPGKGREEDPRKSAAKNRRRDRMLAANVANSQKK